ncbi:aminotransferase class I/II-fold pyridoxal phosphate-dependent enzyme [Streptomyces sp. NPDC058279]|uniref:aminotransferase class I/II-fold pyridoxal phosphate-dependent enzyme n=1 Tax=Streptomyces sp. NPDC058279 TaxID=3346418 RepID=UPI0036EA0B75
MLGDRFSDLGEVRQLCEAAARQSAVVLVDESNANYCPPAFSAANLAPDVDNLIVARGLSKAYGLGGLRLGYCVTSAATTGLVRRVVPPLQPSSLSLRIGRRVLEVGDITEELRSLIATNKRRTQDLLTAAGLASARPAVDHLPYIMVPDRPQAAIEHLAAHGVQGKLHPFWSAWSGEPSTVGRVSVPLDSGRLVTLDRQLGRLSTAARPPVPPTPRTA